VEDSQVRMNVLSVEVHENYDQCANDYDVALLRVDGEIVFNNYVQPICLTGTAIPGGTQTWTAGWGLTTGIAAQRNQIN